MGHVGSNGSTFGQRCAKYVKLGAAGEGIFYGNVQPDTVILELMIDNGVPSRGHRKAILSSTFTKMSCFTGAHSSYKKMTVINYNS